MCREIGITRNETEIPLHKLDYHIRADLDTAAERVLAVLKPLKLVLTNLPEDYSHTVEAKVRVIYLYSFPFLYSLSFSRGDVRYSFLGKPSYALPYFLRPYAQHQAGSWKFLYRQKILRGFAGTRPCLTCCVCLQLFPSNPDSGTYPVPLSRVVYIEETDFKEADPDKALKAPGRPGEKKEKFFGMAPGKECVLK